MEQEESSIFLMRKLTPKPEPRTIQEAKTTAGLFHLAVEI
jgi:hypothetical protein